MEIITMDDIKNEIFEIFDATNIDENRKAEIESLIIDLNYDYLSNEQIKLFIEIMRSYIYEFE